MSKTLLLLGGSRYAMPVIEAAHELGVKVVTCDYLPGNYSHRFSDGYVNASIVDGDAVLDAAAAVFADGIMSFAADPGVVSAAYAAEKLGLPFQGSFEAVSILQDKEKFRSFLRDNGFNCPETRVFCSADDASVNAEDVTYPVIVKPVDSAGSKGCMRVESPCRLPEAAAYALSFSRDGRCIAEQFLEKKGDSSDADAFVIDGRFECISFTSQLFDVSAPNPYTPAAYAMPSSLPVGTQEELSAELQRLADLLGLRSGVFNIETRVASDGKPYIMEVSPRGGGNRLSEMLRFATDGEVDLVKASVQAALGMQVESVSAPRYKGYWCQLMLHSERAGVFSGIEYAPGFKEKHVAEEQLWVNPGSSVEAFNAANHAFGSVMLQFEDESQLEEFLRDKERFMKTVIE